MFEPVDTKASFPKMEERILQLWRDKDVFKRSIAAREGGPRFVLYEGPPTTNASPGIHWVMPRAIKDAIPRYRTMKGYYAPRIGGWDTHGLPVELQIEKELSFSSKAQIEEYGIERFNARCRQAVFQYIKEFEDLTERVGYWVDMEHAYSTMDNSYMESVWWALKQIWDKGLLYQGYRVTPHCPRCETSLSSHEVAQGYQENTADPSVYVKFRVVRPAAGGPPELAQMMTDRATFLLAWTTTPWTLPGNAALAVAADADYAVVEVAGEHLVLADALREQAGLGDYPVVGKVEGRDLVGTEYEPLYDVDIRYVPEDERAYRVIEGDFVSMEDGTGIVHIAPAYGEIDFEVADREGLPLVHTVELNGTVTTNLVTGFTPKAWEHVQRSAGPVMFRPARRKLDLPGAGKFVKDADPLILEDLESRGLLYRSETIRHTYPFCWRCDSPLLYYAKETWYIRTTAVKDALIRGNEEINWYPAHTKYGRFGDWLENNVDWALSRERYWGTPLPVWQCAACGRFDCIGSVKELGDRAASALREPLDLHRPFVDDITLTCPGCGGEMRRVAEVIDCWFDSGAMPFAEDHYPFENETLLEDGRFPADYICEAIDQTRGWFYSLHAISTLLFGRPSFRNVICHGHILDARGEKMSKSRGNMVDPWEVVNKFGADMLRWYIYTSAPAGNSRRYSDTTLAEMTRHFLLTLWNVYSFFVMYANIDDFNPETSEAPLAYSELDRWILSDLNQLVLDVDAAMDGYDPTAAGRKIEPFVNGLSNWYVRRSRRRFWKSENDADKLAAYHTLYRCLVTLAKLLAPLTPFVAEEIYQNLVCSVSATQPDSVHLADFPAADEALIDRQLSDDTRLAMKVCSLGRAARSKAGIKVRQPLSRVVVKVGSKRDREGLERLAPQVLEELNVKKIEFAESDEELERPGLAAGTEAGAEPGVTAAMDTGVTPELAAEGLAREIVHRLQTMRRNAGFDIADHIVTYYDGDDYVKSVLTDFNGYISQETLSRELVEGVPDENVTAAGYKLSGHEVRLAVKRMA